MLQTVVFKATAVSRGNQEYLALPDPSLSQSSYPTTGPVSCTCRTSIIHHRFTNLSGAPRPSKYNLCQPSALLQFTLMEPMIGHVRHSRAEEICESAVNLVVKRVLRWRWTAINRTLVAENPNTHLHMG